MTNKPNPEDVAMPKKPKKNNIDIEKLDNIRDLKRRAEEFVSDELTFYESDEMSDTLREQFWERVEAFESLEWITSFDLLVQGGMALPAPKELDDLQLTAKLWEVIRGLAMLRMFLYNTNHLSDRELYKELWHHVLREENPVMPINENSACHIDLVSSGSEEDIELYLRYYADEEARQIWSKDWPEDDIPEHEAPPYDRDRYLPARDQAEWQNCSQAS